MSGLSIEQKILAASAAVTLMGYGTAHLAPWVLPRAMAWAKSMLGGVHFGAGDFIEVGPIRLSDEARMRHTHIVGATGCGKSVLLEHLIYRDLLRGYGALIIDPKGDRDLFLRIKDFCRELGRESDLHLLSASRLDESVRWNPCRIGNVSELQSKFFCASKYEHSFYAKAAELALLDAFRALLLDGECRPIDLVDLVMEFERLSNHGKDENLKGLYFDLQNLAQGEWAPVISRAPKPGNPHEISLLDLIRKNEILYVDLPTEGKSVQSSRIGALLLQEITLISGLRKRFPALRGDQPFGIYVDEFDAFATDPFITFLNKGRSSGFMIHMAHQTLSDLERVSPTFMGQLMGNPNIRFIFRVDLPADAESLSKLFGTKSVIRKTFQTQDGQLTGLSSNREAQEFRIHPDAIKEFKVGQCAVSIKTERVFKVVQLPRVDRNDFSLRDTPSVRAPLSTSSVPCEASRPAKINGPETNIYDRLLKGEIHSPKEVKR